MKISRTGIIALPLFIENHFHENGLKSWLNTLSPDAQIIYTKREYPDDWYDLNSIFLDPLQRMCDMFYDGDYFGAEEMGRYGAESTLNNIFRIFIKLGAPEYIAKKSSNLFSNYYQGVTCEVLKIKKGEAKIRIHDFEKLREINARVIIGWIKYALELSGAKNIKAINEQKIVDDKNVIDFTATWD